MFWGCTVLELGVICIQMVVNVVVFNDVPVYVYLYLYPATVNKTPHSPQCVSLLEASPTQVKRTHPRPADITPRI